VGKHRTTKSLSAEEKKQMMTLLKNHSKKEIEIALSQIEKCNERYKYLEV